MRVNPVDQTNNDNFNNPKKIIINKQKPKVDDSFYSALKDALNNMDNKKLTPQERLAADGLILTDEEIKVLKSFLY